MFRVCPCQCMVEPCCLLILPWLRGQGGPCTMVCTLLTLHGVPLSKWSQTMQTTLTHNSRYASFMLNQKLKIELWSHIFIWMVQRILTCWPSLPSGVAWYLGSSCGQRAPEPCQLELRPQQSNAHSMTHGANMDNHQRNTTEYDN